MKKVNVLSEQEYKAFEDMSDFLSDMLSAITISEDEKKADININKLISLVLIQKYKQEYNVSPMYGGGKIISIDAVHKLTKQYRSININQMDVNTDLKTNE